MSCLRTLMQCRELPIVYGVFWFVGGSSHHVSPPCVGSSTCILMCIFERRSEAEISFTRSFSPLYVLPDEIMDWKGRLERSGPSGNVALYVCHVHINAVCVLQFGCSKLFLLQFGNFYALNFECDWWLRDYQCQTGTVCSILQEDYWAVLIRTNDQLRIFDFCENFKLSFMRT